MNKNRIARLLGILLAIVLFFGCLFSVREVQKVEPPRLQQEETEALQAETLSGGRGTTSDGDEDSAEETSDDEAEDVEETENSTEERSEASEASPEENPSSGAENTAETEDNAGTGDEGKSDSSSGSGGNAEDKPGDTDGGNTGREDGEDKTDGPTIITDLDQYTGRVLKPSELTNDTLTFMARAAGGKGLSLEVRYRYAGDKGNGTRLYVSGKDSYETALKFGQNIFTLILRQDGKKLKSVVYNIEYRQSADEDNPESGDYPPKIRMISPEEEKWPYTTSNRNFVFKLSVTDTQTGKALTAGNISVSVTNPSGEALPVTVHGESYEMWLERPNVGDVNVFTIRVTAWDEDGCSASYKVYTLTYQAVDSGNVIGKATVVLDATTVGMGVLDTFTGVEVRQDENIAELLCKLLPENGYELDYAGSSKIGFYIRALESGSINTGTIPARLWEMVQRDNIGLMDKGTADSLGEHDYTRGAGWMYSINGSVYEDRGMSERYLQDGDTLYLRFTLAYGKDIGGYETTGGSYGRFSSYCYRYVDGGETFLGHGTMKEIERVEPTAENAGYLIRECERCGAQEREEIPPLGPTEAPEPTVQPTPEPTEAPEPTVQPTPEPTEVPEPTVQPTPEPTEAPEPAEVPEPTAAPAEAGVATTSLKETLSLKKSILPSRRLFLRTDSKNQGKAAVSIKVPTAYDRYRYFRKMGSQ